MDYKWGKFQGAVCGVLGCSLLLASGFEISQQKEVQALTALVGGLLFCATGVGLLRKRRYGVVLVCVMFGMTLVVPLTGHRPPHPEGYLVHAVGVLFWGLPALFYYPKRWKALR